MRYFLLLTAAVSMLTLGSCDDFLDRSPQGQFTEDDNPNALVDGKVFNLYTLMRNYNVTAGVPAFAIEGFRSEDAEKGSVSSDNAAQAEMFDDFIYTTTDGLIKAYWSQNYAIIYQCNDVLDAIEAAKLTDENSLRNKGEAHLFRAYCYFNLARAYGDVPLVTFKVNDASEANVPKVPVAEVYKLIDADLTAAESLLPQSWIPEYLGRLTWGAARALHARTYMMRNQWDSLYVAATDVMAQGTYNLNTPYDQIFTDQGENSSESVLELQCTSTAALPASDKIGSQFCEVQGVRGDGEWNLGWGYNMATQLLVDAYEPGDPRKNATLLYFRTDASSPITPDNTNAPYGESPVSLAMGAAFNKKAYTDPALRREFTKQGFWVNIRLIRYADVVLMAAEGANELGRTGEAMGYLEQVRARARGNNSNVLPPITSASQTVLRDAIRHERRVELGMESGRFYDLVRWGIASEVLHAAGKANYQPKNALLPLPQDEIDKSRGVLVQNPNY